MLRFKQFLRIKTWYILNLYKEEEKKLWEVKFWTFINIL